MLRAYSKSEPTGKLAGSSGYATALLASLGFPSTDAVVGADRHPALVWAESGAMAVTGLADGPPALAPGRLATCARDTIAALTALVAPLADHHLDGAALLGERAALLGLGRRGTMSAGGSCRVLRARDGWIALNLPRPEDYALVPAWLERTIGADPWDAITAAVARRAAAPLVARARLIGLAAAIASAPAPSSPPPWHRVVARGPRAQRAAAAPPLVVDLSSLWAGPLATHLLALCGARVLKIESVRRPDGARCGSPAFFDLLNAGKESVALDLATADGRTALERLIARADVVVESARPRALAQLGIDAAALVRRRPGLTWVGITGYGRTGRGANWIAYGDDAAAAAGLASTTGAANGSASPLFCGDAIADPLTGMHAALAACAAHRQGGGVLVSLALRDVAAHVLGFGPATGPARVRKNAAGEWEVCADGERVPVRPPRARAARGSARPLGADTAAVLRAVA